MSTIKSSSEHLTLNADGASKDIKFQANGVEKASISSAGAFTSTTIDATALTGALPAISAANLTNVPAANITGTLPAIDGSNLTGMGGGKILQVVNVIDTSSTTSTTDSYADTGLTASITPSATSSKVLVIVNQDGTVQSGDTSINFRCYRDSTEIGGTIIGRQIGDSNNSDGTPAFFGFTILDTPSSTSALTFKTQFANKNATGTVRLNNGSGSSTMCLMEVAG